MFDTETSLADRLDFAINSNPHLAGRTLRFETEEGRVTLQGVVKTFYQKQMAQEAVRHVDGVEQIDNRLEVTWC